MPVCFRPHIFPLNTVFYAAAVLKNWSKYGQTTPTWASLSTEQRGGSTPEHPSRPQVPRFGAIGTINYAVRVLNLPPCQHHWTSRKFDNYNATPPESHG